MHAAPILALVVPATRAGRRRHVTRRQDHLMPVGCRKLLGSKKEGRISTSGWDADEKRENATMRGGSYLLLLPLLVSV